ncbi:HAMP domain-containing protein [Neiella marina]|uniref:histidine kinase n=1 Tax=Neiella holothuriorum TaxID=2870530 RepID=A0ABS7EHH5_9GAMM|nr:ATP-binding protein [Neiella holothuriorum]MBW8191791.1 HAMP domain-containing protein [Neiella holothuriorum]
MKFISAMNKWLVRWTPKTLPSRVLLLVLMAVLASQLLLSVLWHAQQQRQENEGLKAASQWMAEQIAHTINNFANMQAPAREDVIQALTHTGNSRFFVMLSPQHHDLPDAEQTPQRTIVAQVLTAHFADADHPGRPAQINIHSNQPLRHPDNNLHLSQRAFEWAKRSLLVPSESAPIVTVQVPMPDEQWLLLATLMPEPYTLLEPLSFALPQWGFMAISTLILAVIVIITTRRLIRPLRQLAQAADLLGRDIDSPPIAESGSSEVTMAARAFNAMQDRLQRFIKDREALFSAISHDLKTPITRMRLRAELLEDDEHRERFIANLDELDLMVKGALQSVKDSDIHENPEPVDIDQLLATIKLDLASDSWRVRISGHAQQPFIGKPLALKRVLTNLIDNAINYGERVHVIVRERQDNLYLYFHDQGPGVPTLDRERVFEPYVRLDNSKNREGGSGLGLAIVRNIVHGHGGEIALNNHPHGGLVVRVLLPHQQAFQENR